MFEDLRTYTCWQCWKSDDCSSLHTKNFTSRILNKLLAHFWRWHAGDPCSSESRPLQLEGYYGTITSSNYPDQYNHLADCQWRIIAEDQYDVSGISSYAYLVDATSCCNYTLYGAANLCQAQLLTVLRTNLMYKRIIHQTKPSTLQRFKKFPFT